MAPITINGITFDPVADAQPMRALSLEAKDAADSNFILVGITGSGTTSVEQDAELEKLGLRLHGYVAPGTYLFKYEASDLEAVRKLDFVDWANVYMKNWKVNPALRSRQSSNAGDQTRLLTLAMSPARSSSRDKQQVDAVLHKGVVANSEALLDEICTRGHVPRAEVTVCRNKLRFSTETRFLDDLTQIDEIRAILPVAKPQLHNNVARDILRADVNINGTQFQGEGEVVCVADTGFDRGLTDSARMHPAPLRSRRSW